MKRFAIYFTPSDDTGLAAAAENWFGRSIWSAECAKTPQVPGIRTDRMQELLKAPRHYGFHGTLKPPFRVAQTTRVEKVNERLADFAQSRAVFRLPQLRVTLLQDFFCLRPETESAPLSQLAADIVQEFDDLRLPPTKAEIAKRNTAALSPSQQRMLQAWGYPYVMSEFRFHLTLTGKTADPVEREKLENSLKSFFPKELTAPLLFDSISLFVEEDGQDMYCLASHQLKQNVS